MKNNKYYNKMIFAGMILLSMIIFSSCALAPTITLSQTDVPVDVTVEPDEVVEQVPVAYTPPNTALESVDLQTALINVYELVNPSVVYIVTPTGSGSGFVFDSQGHIVTNNHVVANQNNFEIVFASGDRKSGSLIGSDTDSDLAVLKVDELPSGVEPLALGDFTDVKVGQIVVAIGNPFGEQGSMSMGIVSGVGRSLRSQRGTTMGSTYTLPEVIQTDAPINPGNSGGPLLNLDGEVIGINSAIASTTGSGSGVGFSIPVSAVQKIVPSLIENGKYAYSYMGVGFDNEVSLSEQDIYGVPQTQGAYVLNVEPGTPADQAGLIGADPSTGAGGDLIIAIDGNPVQDFPDLNSYLVYYTSPGQTVELTVIRNGEQINLQLTLGARP